MYHQQDFFEQKKKRQSTTFKMNAAFSAVVQRTAPRKMFGVGVLGVTGTLKKADSRIGLIERGRGPHDHVETAVDWCS